MILLGVTGGIGMGKSTSGSILERLGVPVVDTDGVAREVVAPGSEALEEIRQAFGGEMLQEDGSLNRARLAERAFAEADARARLEKILHPRIRHRWLARAAGWRAEGRSLGVVVIPLLFETEADRELDAVVCVACSTRSQWTRLRARGWSEEHIRKRLAAQWAIDAKIDRAQFLVWTEPPVGIHEAQLRRILASLGVPSGPTRG